MGDYKKGELFCVGDLVKTHKSYNPQKYYICKIIDIVDAYENSYSEYNIITGWGDSNSKVKLDLLIIGVETDNVKLIEEVNDGEIIRRSPPNVFLRSAKYNIKELKKHISDYESNIRFFMKNRRIEDIRDEKLNNLLQ